MPTVSPITAGTSSLGPSVVTGGAGTYQMLVNSTLAHIASLMGSLGVTALFDNRHEDGAPPVNGTWARSRFRFGETAHQATGSLDTYRKSGAALISIRTPVSSGDKSSMSVADSVRNTLKFGVGKRASAVFDLPHISGIRRDGPWWLVEVTVPVYNETTVVRPTPASGSSVGFEASSNTIRSRFQTLVVGTQGIPVSYDNFSPPISAPLWAALNIERSSNGLVDTGARRYRVFGAARASLFVNVNSGLESILALMDIVDSSFRSVEDQGVLFGTPSAVNQGRFEGKWWRVDLLCPFVADEQVT